MNRKIAFKVLIYALCDGNWKTVGNCLKDLFRG